MKAVFADVTIADSSNTVIVEGNHYFPEEDVKMEYLRHSNLKTTCPWKGEASYYDVKVGDQEAINAAWVYLDPKKEAAHIKGLIAFTKDVKVAED